MSSTEPVAPQSPAATGVVIPLPLMVVFRGIGQVFFQENALSGLLFVVGIALSSPVMAVGLVVGSAVGCAVAWALKFDRGEILAGIYGFNAALVGIASFFFFQPGPASIGVMIAGSALAAVVTYAARRYLPFPTYTGPFVVTTWAVYFIGSAIGALPVEGYPLLVPNLPLGPAVEVVGHGVGQVMFQASIWTGLFFLAGIAVSDRTHAAWVLVGAIVGGVVAGYHVQVGERAVDPERMVERDLFENIRLGLYGYNATLAPVALFLWRRSAIAPLLGMLLTVPITELFPMTGLPALTAPFVLATWAVLGLSWVEGRLFGPPPPPPA